MSERAIVVIPTYNEVENVSPMIDAVMSLPLDLDLLFVDDNSPDGTADKIISIQDKYPNRVFLEKRPSKRGLGTAYIHGFKFCLEKGYSFIIEMDCDFSHNPKDLVRLLEEGRKGADLVIGSRYCKGGRIRNWPFLRWLMSYFASIYVRVVLLINIKDTTAGFKCYRSCVLKNIELNNIHFKGYAFQICMKYAAYKKGYSIKEIPIVFEDRRFGESKMSTKIFKEAFLGVWKMRSMKL